MNKLDYQAIVAELAEDALQLVNDYDYDLYEAVHEIIEGSEYAIYYRYHNDILRYTKNSDAALDVYSSRDLGDIVAEKGLDELNSVLAFWALAQDVMDYLS